MNNLSKNEFYKNFKKIENIDYIVRKAKLTDKKLFMESFNYTKEEATEKINSLIKCYNKNIEAPFYIIKENKLIGEIL